MVSSQKEIEKMDKLIRFEQGLALIEPSVSFALAEFERQAKEIKAKQDALKQRILEEMESNGILKIETDDLVISYVAPTSRESFDSKAFKKNNPDLYDEYISISPVKASVRMKLKGVK